jgi:hypothetical protein
MTAAGPAIPAAYPVSTIISAAIDPAVLYIITRTKLSSRFIFHLALKFFDPQVLKPELLIPK